MVRPWRLKLGDWVAGATDMMFSPLQIGMCERGWISDFGRRMGQGSLSFLFYLAGVPAGLDFLRQKQTL